MTKSQLQDLIDRYLKGEASRKEASLIEQFFAQSLENKSLPNQWGKNEKNQVSERLYYKITQKIRRQKVKRIRLSISAASAILLLIVTSYMLVNQRNTTIPANQVVNTVVSTSAGTEQRSIFLDDGSYVLLSPGATLKYPEEFTTDTRKVILNGEAWFDIQRDTSKPFQVVADEITTTVLGTSFSINSDPDNVKVEVTVTSGRVRVASKIKELAILEQDDLLAYEAGKYTVTRMDQNQGNKVDQLPVPGNWKLANVTMAEAMSFVGKRWGKSFTIDNPIIKDCPLYASFNAEDTLEEVLMVLCGVSNSEYKLDNEKITIYGHGCQ